MKRHGALIALSHDHHHTLVQARRLRRAADGDEGDVASALADFASFFANVTVPHFREEEEVFFPLVGEDEEARPLLAQALLDHQRLRAQAARLEDPVDARARMRDVAALLEAHVRHEERRLFPRDVLVFVAEGSASVTIDGEDRLVRVGEAVIIEKGRRRRIVAGPTGVRYLSVHRSRPPLQIQSAVDRPQA